jgi:hypothetical protein
MGINAATVTAKVLQIRSTAGKVYELDSVVYVAANGEATFTFAHTFSAEDNGIWDILTSTTDRVLNDKGVALAAGVKVGTLRVEIPVSTGTTAPSIKLVSVTPSAIVTAGSEKVSIVVALTDV